MRERPTTGDRLMAQFTVSQSVTAGSQQMIRCGVTTHRGRQRAFIECVQIYQPKIKIQDPREENALKEVVDG